MTARLMKWRGSEPVRLFVWPAIIILVGLALTKGIIDGSTATALYALIPLALGVPVELARANVTPAAKAVAKDAATAAVDTAAVDARAFARDKFGNQGTEVVDAVVEQIKARIYDASRPR